jgi:GT2 family glycosyltransferase
MNPDHSATNSKPTGLVVLMPTRGAVSIETMLCLREHLDDFPHKLLTVFRKPVVEARNQLAKEARELNCDTLDFDAKYVLWVDDDAWWPAGHVDRAVRILEANPSVDMISGLVGLRKPLSDDINCAVDKVGIPILAYRPGQLIGLEFASLHWAVMRRELLSRVGNEPFNLIPKPIGEPWPEDFSFCIRARKAGAKMVSERSLQIGHVDVRNG